MALICPCASGENAWQRVAIELRSREVSVCLCVGFFSVSFFLIRIKQFCVCVYGHVPAVYNHKQNASRIAQSRYKEDVGLEYSLFAEW